MEIVTRPVFEPDGASVEATAVQDQASPINNSTAIARFEFEAGRGNEGSKVLMVEWEDDDTTRGKKGDWHVSWEGKKKAVLTVGDESVEETHRVYFFIPPRVHVPPAITLIYRPSNGGEEMRWEVKTLPAIFPPELGASARTAGKKGVLHTIWAKQRLSVLQQEIEAESKNDFDGIGLDLVLKEKAWIEANFGIGNRPSIVIPSGINPASPSSPTSPRSPGGSRLSEKLKGLRLGTSDQALTPRPGNLSARPYNPLSPQTSDLAISSFAAIHGGRPGSLPPQRPFAAAQPPASLLAQQAAQSSRTGSSSSIAGALAATGPDVNAPSSSSVEPAGVEDTELFQVPMSPRSPDMPVSPFSLRGDQTLR